VCWAGNGFPYGALLPLSSALWVIGGFDALGVCWAGNGFPYGALFLFPPHGGLSHKWLHTPTQIPDPKNHRTSSSRAAPSATPLPMSGPRPRLERCSAGIG